MQSEGRFPARRSSSQWAKLGSLALTQRLRLRRSRTSSTDSSCRRWSAADSGLRSLLSACSRRLCMYPIYASAATSRKKQKYMPGMQTGERKSGCFGLTEPCRLQPWWHAHPRQKEARVRSPNGEKDWWITPVDRPTSRSCGRRSRRRRQGARLHRRDDRPGFRQTKSRQVVDDERRLKSGLLHADVRFTLRNIMPKTEGLKNAMMCLIRHS